MPWKDIIPLALGFVFGLGLLWAAWWMWWILPKRQTLRLSRRIRDARAQADFEEAFRKTGGQLIGGAAVLIGAAGAYLQFYQQQLAARDVLITNQLSKGFEQLGSETIGVRLGGIYALEGVINASRQYRQQVLVSDRRETRVTQRPRFAA